ncbi:MAG: two pore domain potassium channel family protein [Leptolyngbyaceae cyanobacterium MAG.088]|nr:two pore domain potassium channel family protein [Leptolyngbyaceae cyanobacterium MAG.088]
MSPLLKNKHQKYRQLLIVLAVIFMVSPFLKAGIGNILSISLLLYTIIVVINSFALPRRLMMIYGAIAITAFCLEVIASVIDVSDLNQPFTLISQVIFAIYLAGAAYWIGRDIFTAPNVTIDTVRGGISVYMLIGFVWALLYGIVNTLDANAFSQPLIQQDSYLRTIHFSFTTLTTLGYGDIVPLSEVAQVLTNLEAIVGQMYSSVLIAILIGSYLAQRPNRKR